MNIKFEVVSKYADAGLTLPERKTKESAGYDLAAAEDYVIEPYENLVGKLAIQGVQPRTYSLEEVAALTKANKCKPSLISTGMKCKLAKGTYLELSVRSSSPLKYWLIMANGVGIIDGDYYNNPDNEGEIFLQMINMSPYPIEIKKGEFIGQGIIKPYLVCDDDKAFGERTGGFGSTTVTTSIPEDIMYEMFVSGTSVDDSTTTHA